MFTSVNEANREDNNGLHAPPGAQQMNYPHMNAQWNSPPVPPGYNVLPTSQMWNAPNVQQFHILPVIQQWNGNAAPQTPQSPAFHQTFQMGKPFGLGITLIVVGILHIGLGIGLFFLATYITLYSGITFWGAVFFIIAGSLSVAGHSRASICLVKGSLALNIITSIVSVIGLIFSIVDFFYDYWYYCGYYGYYDCDGGVINGGHIVCAILVITYLLLFCISVSISVFGCKALKHPPTNIPQVFVIQNGAGLLVPPSAYPVSSPANVQSPPAPYMVQGAVKR